MRSKTKNIGVIIQARTSSSRLPGKVLKKLPFSADLTVLEQVINRVSASKRLKNVIIATTEEEQDDKIVDLLKKKNVEYFRGENEDVLSRYYFAATKNQLDIIVRITADCPCIDPDIIDLVIDTHIKRNVDYTSNRIKCTYPRGLDVEVFNFDCLKYCHEKAKSAYEREHVTTLLYSNNKASFKNVNVESSKELYAPEIRITLDTEEDYILLCVVFDELYREDKMFKTKDIITLFKNKPWLSFINKGVMQKKGRTSLKEEMDDAINLLNLQELRRVSEILEKYRDNDLRK